jgi:hypothetical protein
MKRQQVEPADLKAAPAWCAYALEHPVTDLEQVNSNPHHHQVGAWRIAVVVDATANMVEGWPCWHVSVIYGEQQAGQLRPAIPLQLWTRAIRRAAPRIIRGVLRHVGEPITERITDPTELLAEHERRGGGEPHAALHGRRHLTHDEAGALLRNAPGAMERINPTFARLVEELTGQAEQEAAAKLAQQRAASQRVN